MTKENIFRELKDFILKDPDFNWLFKNEKGLSDNELKLYLDELEEDLPDFFWRFSTTQEQHSVIDNYFIREGYYINLTDIYNNACDWIVNLDYKEDE